MEYEEKGRRNVDVQFETIKSEKVNFGRNNFLEVARKRAKTSDGTNEFISVSRGYYLPDKTERFKRSLTDRKSTRLNSSHSQISYAVFCLKKKKLISYTTNISHSVFFF